MLPFAQQKRGSILVLLAIFSWVMFLRLPFFFHDMLTYSWDEGLYFTIASQMLHGAKLYVDAWDNKPIGIFLIYAAAISLFGKTLFAVNLASSLAVFGTASILYFIGARALGNPRIGVLCALVFPAYMLDYRAEGANAEN